jgi:hypothetical protein
MEFENLLRGCFSDTSFEFGVHPLDSKRAKKMFDIAIREQIPIKKYWIWLNCTWRTMAAIPQKSRRNSSEFNATSTELNLPSEQKRFG